MTEQIFICYPYLNDYEIEMAEHIITNLENNIELKNKIKFRWFLPKKQVPKNESDFKKWVNKELKDTKKTIILLWTNTLNLSSIQYIIKKSEERQNEIIKISLYKDENNYFPKSLWWWVWSLWWWFTTITPESSYFFS